MAPRSLTQRVEILEQKVGDLRELPARVAAVESQILQLREEIRVEFSAIRNLFDGVDERFNGIDQQFDGIDQRFDRIDQRFDVVADGSVHIDKLLVQIAEQRAVRLKGEVQGAAAEERLDVAGPARRREGKELAEQLALAAGPFDEGGDGPHPVGRRPTTLSQHWERVPIA